MLITGIKSKPVYTPLSADTRGRYHIMVGSGVGADPLLRVIDEMRAVAPQALGQTRVLYRPESPADIGAGADGKAILTPRSQFGDAALANVQLFDRLEPLLENFQQLAAQSLMGTRLYVAGPESFIGLVMKIALQFNLNQDEIRAEECGSPARRVYCIHCRSTTKDVTTNIVRCHCNRWLLVRDHYSRRLAAYMGVMADAEAPGELPELKEVFR